MTELLKLQPVFKEIVWGGNKLKTEYNFNSDLNNIAEAWMLSARDDGDNIILNGVNEGKSFKEFIAKNKQLLGSKGEKYDDFPLLIKFIDAKSDLSVQVHPDDSYAKIHENSYGKTEAWYILDCDEGAELIYGFKNKITKDEFKKSIENNTFLDLVNKVKVKKGDVFFIASGTLHAIGGGILLAEVQQNCNTTYRVYDYNRKVNGKLRELHIDKALDVTNTVPSSKSNNKDLPIVNGNAVTQRLCSCDFFTMESLEVNGDYSCFVNDDSFISLLALSGDGEISSDNSKVNVKAGDSLFIPAGIGKIDFTGNFKFLVSSL